MKNLCHECGFPKKWLIVKVQKADQRWETHMEKAGFFKACCQQGDAQIASESSGPHGKKDEHLQKKRGTL